MTDGRIFDAINLFKYSPTGQGIRSVGGDTSYRRKYRTLASSVIEKLWEAWGVNKIDFADLPAGTVGESSPSRGSISVSRRIEPSNKTANYATPENQGKLAATSCNIVHEAVHLVSSIASYPEEESLCRTLQQLYFHDLSSSSHNYQSQVTGTSCTARFLPTTPFYSAYRQRRNRVLSQDLIDDILSNVEYRRDLESEITADFIVRSLSWWGGLSNRWPSTRGYYLRSLAAQQEDYAESILLILQSLTPDEWQSARTCCGNIENIRDGLKRGHHIYSRSFANRISQVQSRLSENFGIQPRA